MSVQNNTSGSESVVLERPAAGGVYASLFEKINLSPVSELSALDLWQDAQAMSDATADERLTAGMQVFLECLTKAGAKVEKLDKSLIDHHIAELDYLKLIQRENIGTTKDRRLLELELNTWVRSLVTEMTDPGDELQASHPLRDAKVVVEDIEDNPGFFRVKLYAVPHFQVEGMDVNLSLVSQMPKAKS